MATDEARDALRVGDLERARALAVEQVKSRPGEAGPRALLFQLCVLEGDWERAVKQLDVIGKIDAAKLDFVTDYKTAIACEGDRAEVIAGRKAPTVFGQPSPWIAKMTEALRLDAIEPNAAMDLRGQALEEAEATGGEADGTPFDWMADADQRFGPALECIVNGEYHWVPFSAFSSLDLEPPADLRDHVWAVGIATFANGGSWPVMVPVRYPASDIRSGGEVAHALARRTDWHPLQGDHYRGVGQRMLATEADDLPFLDMRKLTFQQDTA